MNPHGHGVNSLFFTPIGNLLTVSCDFSLLFNIQVTLFVYNTNLTIQQIQYNKFLNTFVYSSMYNYM